ncbi:small ubiquitin-related modifier 1-like [Rutidosis leptorrhynchoides]|uniref:small ubiquitin-related modifier 1-like n=1 Tax=Rutidosis leptorrhynchoides TaxID=125765 RepID=UPI003A98EFB2
MSIINGEKNKPAGNQKDFIILKVKGHFKEGRELFFQIKRTKQFRRLMNAYCDKTSQERNSLVFLFDGSLIRPDQTPDELDMENKDEIEAMTHHTGGTALIPQT